MTSIYIDHFRLYLSVLKLLIVRIYIYIIVNY